MARTLQLTRTEVGSLLRRADNEGFAVPAFNYSDIWDFLAIVEAAEELRAPVFLSCIEGVATEIGVELCGSFGCAAMRKADTLLIHHLDHCVSTHLCREAIDHGYPSVMIDASMHPLERNEQIVKEVVEYAHPRGVFVEGEVGRIRGNAVESAAEDGNVLAKIEDVIHFVGETGIDSLAAGIGTAHGFYRTKPEIDFALLGEINKVVDVPLVLHGGTGLSQDQIRSAIRWGINKVNVGTIIYCTYMNAVRTQLIERGENAYTLDVMRPARHAVREQVRSWIKVCMADGRL